MMSQLRQKLITRECEEAKAEPEGYIVLQKEKMKKWPAQGMLWACQIQALEKLRIVHGT